MSRSYYSFIREESSDNSVHYLFTTDNGTIYSVYFDPPDFSDYLKNLPLLSESGCLFGFFPIDENPTRKKYDPLVSNTIYRIVEDYFESYGSNKILLFHCDSEDGKQSSRDRLFEKWFNRKSEGFKFSKDGLEVEIERTDGTIRSEYLGLIMHGEEAERLNLIKSEFMEIAVMLIDRKA